MEEGTTSIRKPWLYMFKLDKIYISRGSIARIAIIKMSNFESTVSAVVMVTVIAMATAVSDSVTKLRTLTRCVANCGAVLDCFMQNPPVFTRMVPSPPEERYAIITSSVRLGVSLLNMAYYLG
jgi:hypothetical protein